LAWWDGGEWSVEGLANGNGDQSEFGIPNPVLSIAMRGDTVFAGHLNDRWHDDMDMGYAAMLVNDQWQPCGNPSGIFYFLEEEGRMFSGGVHDSLYGVYSPGIKEWRNGAFQEIPNMPFTSLVQVNDVEYWQGKFYFGGIFDAFGSPRIIAFDGVDQWTPVGSGVGGYFIESICGYGDSLYVSGFLQPGPNVQSTHIQLWDGSAWKPFFPEVEFVGATRDIQVHDGVLYVSGIHTWVGDDTWYGLLRYDGRELCSIGGPMPSGDNGEMLFFENFLYFAVGGTFTALPNEGVARLPLEGLVPDRCAIVGPTSILAHEGSTTRLTVFPNPVTLEATIDLPHGSLFERIDLYDGSGRLIRTENGVWTTLLKAPVHDLESGLYFLRCSSVGRSYWANFLKQ
jgi:hypothetical protein